MSAERRSGLEVPVRIALDASYGRARAPAWREAFDARLERRLVRLSADVGLPARPRARLALDERVRERTGRWFEVLVGEEACRLDWTMEITPGTAPEEVAERVFEAVYWNRHLLLTPSVTNLLQKEYRPAPGKEVAGLLRHALKNGLSIPTALDVMQQWSSGRDSDFRPDYLLEWLLADRFPRVVTVEMGRRQFDSLKGFDEVVGMMREGLFYEVGVKCPRLHPEVSDELDDDQFRSRIGAIAGPVHRGLGVDENLVNETVAHLELLHVKGSERINPANGMRQAVVADRDVAACENVALTAWDGGGFVALATSCDLRRHAASFLTMRHVEHVFKRLNEAFPMPIFTALERYGMADLHAALRLLVEEGVSIRNLRDVLEAVLEFEGAASSDTVDAEVVYPQRGYVLEECDAVERGRIATQLAAHARIALRWQLSEKYVDPGVAVEIGPATEARLRQSDVPLSAEEKIRLHAGVAAKLAEADAAQKAMVVLASGRVRRRLYELVSIEYPRIPILSRDEIAPGRQIHLIATFDPLAPAG